MPKKTDTERRGPAAANPVGRAMDAGETAIASATALAGEAAATGVLPRGAGKGRDEEIPREGDRLRAGDPDTRALDNESVGDTTPGGHMSTPDQGGVDDIGRAMGVQEEDGGELHASSEILDERDRKRAELQPPGRPPHAYEPER